MLDRLVARGINATAANLPQSQDSSLWVGNATIATLLASTEDFTKLHLYKASPSVHNTSTTRYVYARGSASRDVPLKRQAQGDVLDTFLSTI